MSTFYDKTRITFHRGNAYDETGIEKKPFATIVISDLVNAETIEGLCALVRDHVHLMHADFCNVKISTEQWDS
jgi:hypothetical protein